MGSAMDLPLRKLSKSLAQLIQVEGQPRFLDKCSTPIPGFIIIYIYIQMFTLVYSSRPQKTPGFSQFLQDPDVFSDPKQRGTVL